MLLSRRHWSIPFWRKFVDTKLLEILVCPVCKSKLDYQKEARELVCKPCKLAFPVQDNIPIMLVDEARQIQDA